MAFSLACDVGKTTLRIEGIDTDVTWNDVVNAGAGSVAVDGGGTEDPSFFVTEHIANGIYQILKNIQFGDGTNALTFYSKKEMAYFVDGQSFEIKSNATLQLGALQGDWGIDGAAWSLGPAVAKVLINTGQTTAKFYCYSGSLHIRTAVYLTFRDGDIDIRNSIMSGIYDGSQYSYYKFEGAQSLKLNRVYISNLDTLVMKFTPDVFEDVHIHYVRKGISTDATMTAVDLLITSYILTPINNSAAGVTAFIKNPKANIADVIISYADGVIKEQYTCDIHVVDKEGNNLEGVTVTCEDKDSNQVFSADTAADGTIAQQTITYKKWEGTDETETEYSPHRFTFSKNGYTLLVMENITVDWRVNWDVEVKFPERIRARMANPGRLAILR